MRSPDTIRRRTLLALAASAVVPLALASDPEPQFIVLARRTVHLLGHVSRATRDVLDHTVVGQLLAAIYGTPLTHTAPLAQASDAELKSRIRARIANGFAAGDLRIVDGWWVTPVESDCLALLRCMRA